MPLHVLAGHHHPQAHGRTRHHLTLKKKRLQDLFIYYFRLCWAFATAPGLSLAAGVEATLLRWCSGSGVHELQWLGHTDLVALWLWDFPGLGIKLALPVLAGGFSTTEPPGDP